MALNETGITDEDGDHSDWLELYNPGDHAINLGGWSLTDEVGTPNKWIFPEVTIDAGEYLLLFASGKNRPSVSGNLHTNFKLSGGGEYLALYEPDLVTVSYIFDPFFPPQQTDISYGICENQLTFFSPRTPGVGNQLGEQLLTPVFSKERGFYSQPFEVSLSAADEKAEIRYTTDGTRPDPTHGTRYTGPVPIQTTTPLSAVCIRDGRVSAVVSHTYFFIRDILKQPAQPVGYPSGWGTLAINLSDTYKAGSRAPADYEMDPTICNSPVYAPLMEKALTSIPSLSIVTNPGYLFSYSIDPDTGGIYIYTGDEAKDSYNTISTKLGMDWERPASIEYYDPATGKNFQLNSGLRIHGGNSLKPSNSPKHSFRLSFRSEYGASKLNYSLFDEPGTTTRFDHLVLKSTYNYSWIKKDLTQLAGAQYILDRFTKRLQWDTGHIAPHETPVHLYLNGLYWGVYLIAEKINNDFVAEYASGQDEDFDVINDEYHTSTPSEGIVDGNDLAYKEMMNLVAKKQYDELISKHLLDVVNYIDYMLINYYVGNKDWDGNNFFAARNRVEPGNGFQYFCWDAETCLTDVSFNLVKIVDKTLTTMFSNLSSNATFKRLVNERIGRLFFNGGVLTPEHTAALYQSLADQIDTAMIAESARWGDYQRDVVGLPGASLYTLFDHWIPRRDYLLSEYFPKRTQQVLDQFKAAGYIPILATPSQHELMPTVYATSEVIYYTLAKDGPVKIELYTLNGHLISCLINTLQSAGSHVITWREKVPGPGIYLFRFTNAEVVLTGKCLLP
jgi:hypothetical protein